MLRQALEIDWRAKAIEYMDKNCTLEARLGAYMDREKAHRVYSDRMRKALVEIVNLPGLMSWKALQIARQALGMEK